MFTAFMLFVSALVHAYAPIHASHFAFLATQSSLLRTCNTCLACC